MDQIASPAPDVDEPGRVFTAASLASRLTVPRRWLVDNLIPAANVTLIGGDGGTGKSLLALQLVFASVAGKTWLGHPVMQGPALFLSAEDSKDELHRRLAAIASENDCDLSALHSLYLASYVGTDAILAQPEGNILVPTDRFKRIDAKLPQMRPVAIVLDTLADLHSGDENIRSHARSFIALLRGLAVRHDVAVIVLAHPSLSGMTRRSGLSGSTAWNASVRSRLYLERIKRDDGTEPDPDARILRMVKNNYGPTGEEFRVRYKRGVFVPLDATARSFQVVAGQAKVDDTFLSLLAAFEAEGRHVSATPSANYAPAVFAKDGRAEGVTKHGFVEAMSRLFAAKRIHVEEFGRASRRLKRIVAISDDHHARS
jgi:RecA-family ATPase